MAKVLKQAPYSQLNDSAAMYAELGIPVMKTDKNGYLVPMDPPVPLSDKLKRIHEQVTGEHEGFVPVSKYSYLMLLETYTEPLGSTNDPDVSSVTTALSSSVTTALSSSHGVVGRRMAHCRCICGKEVDYPLTWIVRKTRTHCGCRNAKSVKEKAASEYEPRIRVKGNKLDMTGKAFGYFLVESLAEDNTTWNVVCACGAKFKKTGRFIRHNRKQHCGSKVCTRLYNEGKTREQARAMLKDLQLNRR